MNNLLALTLSAFLALPLAAAEAAPFQLEPGNWNPAVRSQLENLLGSHSWQGKKVVLDFDNTLVSRDIGEATFAQLLITDKIKRSAALAAISPDFVNQGKLISLTNVADLSEYYDQLASLDAHPADLEAASNSYAWVVQAMMGLTPVEIIEATRAAYGQNRAEQDRAQNKDSKLEITPGKTGYRVPFFNPEIVDLIGQLLKHGYDLYVVSGSNVWTVRHMVTVELMMRVNAKFGTHYQIPADHVIGASVLLRDKRTGRLVKDAFLAKENERYAALDPVELGQYELTNQAVFPLTGFSGKVANIIQYITGPVEKPFLVAGDSSGDFAMLQMAQYRLWFARLEKKGYQQALSHRIGKPEQATWMIQPVLTARQPGLLKNQSHLKALSGIAGLKLQDLIESLEIWKERGMYRD
ncbi:MAG: HAD family hydrolase [Candidatus Sericytochromatia bacterium]